MRQLKIDHRQIHALQGGGVLVWACDDNPYGLFETIRQASHHWLQPNPRRYGYTWRIYPTSDVMTYKFEGSEEDCLKLANWIDEQGSDYY